MAKGFIEFLPLFRVWKCFCVLKFASELQNTNPNPRSKIVQKVQFLSVSQNSDLSLKLDSTGQNEFRGILVFRNGVLKVYRPNFHAKRSSRLTSRNTFSNGGLFQNFEPTTKFVVSKWVGSWSRFLVLSPSWSYCNTPFIPSVYKPF